MASGTLPSNLKMILKVVNLFEHRSYHHHSNSVCVSFFLKRRKHLYRLIGSLDRLLDKFKDSHTFSRKA